MTAALLAVALALLPLPAALAAPIGASGECYNSNGTQGGKDAVELDPDRPTDPTLPSGTGAANALVTFVATLPEGGCPRYDCGYPDKPACQGGRERRTDYLEAHAASAQVCYNSGAYVDGRCPTRPHGA